MENETITAVPGVAVGHSTDAEAATGVTVLTFPEPNVAVVDVRGGAPGTRETDALGTAIKPVTVNALMFSGGSAFGLAAAEGVTAEIEKEGRGAPTPWGPVPIVPSAIVFDLMTGDVARRPGPDDGATAYLARTEDPAALGRVGAGSGTTVAGWRGPDSMRYGGVGSAIVRLEEANVGALVVLNAVGDVFSLEGEPLTDGLHASLEMPVGPMPDNTTLVCIATDAGIDDRNELRRMAIRAHDALGACIRPTHTRYDGDSTFVVSFGDQPDPNIDMIQQAAFVVVGRAIESAIKSVPDGAL